MAHLYWPAMQKCHKYWRRQNIGARQDFTNFPQTLAVNISAHRRPFKNWCYSWPIQRLSHRSAAWPLSCPKWVMGSGGGGGAPCRTSFSCLDNHGRGQGKQNTGMGGMEEEGSRTLGNSVLRFPCPCFPLVWSPFPFLLLRPAGFDNKSAGDARNNPDES